MSRKFSESNLKNSNLELKKNSGIDDFSQGLKSVSSQENGSLQNSETGSNNLSSDQVVINQSDPKCILVEVRGVAIFFCEDFGW